MSLIKERQRVASNNIIVIGNSLIIIIIFVQKPGQTCGVGCIPLDGLTDAKICQQSYFYQHPKQIRQKMTGLVT